MPLAQQLLTIVLPVSQGVWSSQTGQRWRLHQQVPPGLQHRARGARGDRVRRAETAHRHRPGPHQKPLHPHLGWSHQVGLLAPRVFCFVGRGTGFTSWAGCALRATSGSVRFLVEADGDATVSNIQQSRVFFNQRVLTAARHKSPSQLQDTNLSSCRFFRLLVLRSWSCQTWNTWVLKLCVQQF